MYLVTRPIFMFGGFFTAVQGKNYIHFLTPVREIVFEQDALHGLETGDRFSRIPIMFLHNYIIFSIASGFGRRPFFFLCGEMIFVG